MTYENSASTMILTRNCLALATSEAVTPIGLLKSQITYANGSYGIADLCTGIVTFNSRYRKQPGHNKRNDDPKSYVYTPIYFDDPDNHDNNESLYRQARVHILNTALSAYHRNLFDSALQRAAIQVGCDLSEAQVHTHHINVDKHDNSVINLLPTTDNEHRAIHNALRSGKSTYEALVAGLGEALVLSIFGESYLNYGDCSVYTSKIHGIPYIKHILNQLSKAHLHVNTTELRVRCLNGRYDFIGIEGMSIYELLSALYTIRAVEVVKPLYSTNIAI